MSLHEVMPGRSVVYAVLGSIVALAFAGAPAHAQFGLVPGSFEADSFDPDIGGPVTQAGARPFEAASAFSLNTDSGGNSPEPLRDVYVALPDGFVGNPQATPTCSRSTFDAIFGTPGAACPVASQIGVAVTYLQFFGHAEPFVSAIYNLPPLPGDVADFGFLVERVPVHIIPSLNPAGNYALQADVTRISQGLPVVGSEVTLWGVPADSRHNDQRACDGGSTLSGNCSADAGGRRPFLTNPTNCGADPLTTRIAVDSWHNVGVFDRASYTTESPVTGCDRLRFEPIAAIAPSSTAPDAPTGLSVDLAFPQTEDPDGLGTPPLRTANIGMPEGLTINPGSANGLAACTDAQLGLGTDDPIYCPDGSKIGTASATTPLLEEPLTGSLYLRTQNSSDPESGEMFRLALVFEQPDRGLLIKLAGSAKVDEDSGRIVSEFNENPQVPVSNIELQLKAGPRAPLATPKACGSGAFRAELSSWSGHRAGLTSAMTIGCTPGLGDFKPTLRAGTVKTTSGALSPFVLNITKPDGNAALNGLSMELPEGLLANLKGNLGKQVGSVKAFAGPGPTPFMLPGKVFLEGAYRDAPFSLRAVVPAKAGPFDLGEVVVRQKLYVDPNDAHVTVVSDPLPTIVKGVPVRLQRLDVDVDKPGFVMNPTSCKAKEIKATLGAADGQTAPIVNRFQVGECSDLRFTPKLAMRLLGKKQTRTGGHPTLKTVLTQAKGQANIDKVKVTLPKTVVLDAVNSFDPKLVCDYDKSLKADCPASSIIGKATAQTPVLNKPLTGNVHLVQGIKFGPKGNRIRTTPALLVKLRGEVAINLRGQTTTEKKTNRLVTTFPAVPDAPVSKFSLTINGGNNGILVVTRTRRSKINLCSGKQIASVETDGHNGRNADYNTKIKTHCAKRSGRSKGSRRATGK